MSETSGGGGFLRKAQGKFLSTMRGFRGAVQKESRQLQKGDGTKGDVALLKGVVKKLDRLEKDIKSAARRVSRRG